jgi:hypothetical protein
MDRPPDPPAGARGATGFTGTDLFWILLSGFLLILIANGGLIYFAMDQVSDFRSLIDALC